MSDAWLEGSIQFLGTGNAFSDYRENYFNNALLTFRGQSLLIDCGATAPQALKELGVGVHPITEVVVTHMHDDHLTDVCQAGTKFVQVSQDEIPTHPEDSLCRKSRLRN